MKEVKLQMQVKVSVGGSFLNKNSNNFMSRMFL